MHHRLILIFSLISLMISCGIPKDVLLRMETKREKIEFPVDYSILLPTPTFEEWDSDYNSFNKYLTKEIMRTQMGLSFVHEGVKIWSCFPSAKTHAQLDTATMILNKNEVIGEWRIASHRQISFTDSASIAEEKIYRTSKLIEEFNDDIYLVITPDKFKLYVNPKAGSRLRKSKNYEIINYRYLMVYGLLRAAVTISEIGITRENYLVINATHVEEHKVKGKYIVYNATIIQMIFKRMQN